MEMAKLLAVDRDNPMNKLAFENRLTELCVLVKSIGIEHPRTRQLILAMAKMIDAAPPGPILSKEAGRVQAVLRSHGWILRDPPPGRKGYTLRRLT